MIVPILLIESRYGRAIFTKRDFAISMLNAAVYALAIFAYAAFDRVLVGLVYAIAVTVIADALYLSLRKAYLRHPVISYTAATYTLGTLLAVVVRLA